MQLSGSTYTVTAYLRGRAFYFEDRTAGQSILLQGPFAAGFAADLEAVTAAMPDAAPDDVLAFLWRDCGHGADASALTIRS